VIFRGLLTGRQLTTHYQVVLGLMRQQHLNAQLQWAILPTVIDIIS